ncbi:MAG: glycosyltransferase [Chthoniobacteraceae bacterium]
MATTETSSSAPVSLSVMICSRNPRPEYLAQAIKALRNQTIPPSEWEFILVDNDSTPPIALDLSWHPNARIVIEKEPGILAARLRAIAEASGELLCFFDDDNAPCPTYLADCLEISRTHPWLGAWGAAHIDGKFEIPVPPWARPFLHMLALRTENGNYWSNMEDWRTIPYTAGMAFRRQIGQGFIQWVDEHKHARLLGRRPDILLSHEDIALARMAYEFDLGTGIFERLQLDHYIPARRLELSYMVKLSEGFGYSGILSKWINGDNYQPPNKGKLQRVLEIVQSYRKTPEARACWLASRRGVQAALKFIEQQKAAPARAS